MTGVWIVPMLCAPAVIFNDEHDRIWRSLDGMHIAANEEHHTLPEEHLRAQFVILLASRAAEERLLTSVSSGVDNDICRATDLARSICGRARRIPSSVSSSHGNGNTPRRGMRR